MELNTHHHDIAAGQLEGQVLVENFPARYSEVRTATEAICAPLAVEDYVVQPIVDVSPPKWHLGHTTWFFENFILKPFVPGYQEFNPQFNFVFNSYYESVGARVIRTDRGNLSRPSVDEVYRYRRYVDEKMLAFLEKGTVDAAVRELLLLGLNHEQQHQELLFTDIKYILGNNPLFPAYKEEGVEGDMHAKQSQQGFISMPKGIYEIGHQGKGFCFDNELGVHDVLLQEFQISDTLVTNQEYLEFINDGGYKDFKHWHSEGWEWVKANNAAAPMYWYDVDGDWQHYTFAGLQQIEPDLPVTHINFYEASAFAAWKGMRLPTEFEWEAAARLFSWGQRWEWTNSAYLPYPGYSRAQGAIGEYNGKFMVNQMVLRGASFVTPSGHSRISYRNFFHPNLQWQFTGIRLAK